MLIRRYHAEDCPVLLDLFRDTIMRVNCRDYSPEQVQVWAGCANPERWEKTLAEHVTMVAEIDGVIVGFGDIDPEKCYLDGLYVHADYQRMGIASALCDRLEPLSQTGEVFSEVSLTAEPFFRARGYRVVRRQQVERMGVLLPNAVMVRRLDDPSAK